MRELISAIKAKRGLANLDDAFVEERVLKIFSSDARIKRKFEQSKSFAQFSRSREYDLLLKAVRKELRVIYGVFQRDGRRMPSSEEELDAVLATHVSTRERMPYLDALYAELARRIPAPKVLLDLGCGLNPLTWHAMARHGWRPQVIGIDVSSEDVRFLEEAMRALKIPGKAITLDLVKGHAKLDAISADVALCLKLLDTLEEQERYVSYALLDRVRAPWIVVSFSTLSLGGKKRISVAKRAWFERLLERKGWPHETFTVGDELVYVVRKAADNP
jgi:hypothetical protein